MTAKCIKPIADLIRFTQTDADNAREWAGIQAKPVATKQAPKFGKKVSR